jgi:hypothetical protein
VEQVQVLVASHLEMALAEVAVVVRGLIVIQVNMQVVQTARKQFGLIGKELHMAQAQDLVALCNTHILTAVHVYVAVVVVLYT